MRGSSPRMAAGRIAFILRQKVGSGRTTMNKDQKPVVHVVFSSSAAGSLKQALRTTGCSERVIGQSDDLSFGPIGDISQSERLRWIDNELAIDGYAEVLTRDERFWAEATSAEVHPRIWINRRCAKEYAGLLEFLCRISHTDFGIIDITDDIFLLGRERKVRAHSLSEVAPEQIVEAQLFRRQTCLSAEQIEDFKTAWKQLRTENAPLRIVGMRGLTSAPITYFDDIISSFVPPKWTKCARVITEVLFEQAEGPFRQAGDILISSRLKTLAEAGVFEHQGDLTLPRHSEVRGPFNRT